MPRRSRSRSRSAETHARRRRSRESDGDSGRRRFRSPPRRHDRERRDYGRERRMKDEPLSDEEQRRDRRERHEHERRRIESKQGRRGDNANPFERDVKDEQRWGKDEPKEGENSGEEEVEKEKPNFGLSGKLAVDTNLYNGVVIKYNEPPEARKPKLRWRLYPFKGDDNLPVLYIHRQSAYLIGRDRRVADVPIDHPSCSKQHAAIQYRLVNYTRDDGTGGRRVKPYIIDLGSANGTHLNNQKVEPARYHELHEKDVLKFGFSSREYVVLNEHSQDSGQEDNADDSDNNDNDKD